MRLQPNIGSDRSWVWKVAADYSEQPPTSETLAIRFANSDSESYNLLVFQEFEIFIFIDAALFKTAFEDGQKANASLAKGVVEKADDGAKEEDPEEISKEDTDTNTPKDSGEAENEEVKTD
jgi:Ran-binding protein 1